MLFILDQHSNISTVLFGNQTKYYFQIYIFTLKVPHCEIIFLFLNTVNFYNNFDHISIIPALNCSIANASNVASLLPVF